MSGPPSVLFLCVHNAGRSQMAAALLTHLAGDRIEVRSAGTEPADQINPAAITAMAEIGIDITAAPQNPHPRRGAGQRHRDHHGLRRHLPLLPGVAYRDWKLDDPAGQPPT
jgi:arsenate reductase (thioredoxin)